MNGRWPAFLTGRRVLPLLSVPLPPNLEPGVVTRILLDGAEWERGDFECGRHPAGCPGHWYLVEGGFAGDGYAFAEHDLTGVDTPDLVPPWWGGHAA